VHIVEQYLGAMVAHDWEEMAACLSDDVVRVGPFGDTYTPKAPYVAFLSDLMPKLPGYAMHVERLVDAGTTAVVELSETVEVGGAVVVTPEVLVVDLGVDGLITRIAIYIQRLGGPPPAL